MHYSIRQFFFFPPPKIFYEVMFIFSEAAIQNFSFESKDFNSNKNTLDITRFLLNIRRCSIRLFLSRSIYLVALSSFIIYENFLVSCRNDFLDSFLCPAVSIFARDSNFRREF